MPGKQTVRNFFDAATAFGDAVCARVRELHEAGREDFAQLFGATAAQLMADRIDPRSLDNVSLSRRFLLDDFLSASEDDAPAKTMDEDERLTREVMAELVYIANGVRAQSAQFDKTMQKPGV